MRRCLPGERHQDRPLQVEAWTRGMALAKMRDIAQMISRLARLARRGALSVSQEPEDVLHRVVLLRPSPLLVGLHLLEPPGQLRHVTLHLMQPLDCNARHADVERSLRHARRLRCMRCVRRLRRRFRPYLRPRPSSVVARRLHAFRNISPPRVWLCRLTRWKAASPSWCDQVTMKKMKSCEHAQP